MMNGQIMFKKNGSYPISSLSGKECICEASNKKGINFYSSVKKEFLVIFNAHDKNIRPKISDETPKGCLSIFSIIFKDSFENISFREIFQAFCLEEKTFALINGKSLSDISALQNQIFDFIHVNNKQFLKSRKNKFIFPAKADEVEFKNDFIAFEVIGGRKKIMRVESIENKLKKNSNDQFFLIVIE
jgi:hypothetical protein